MPKGVFDHSMLKGRKMPNMSERMRKKWQDFEYRKYREKVGFKKGNIPWNKGKHIWQNKPHPRGMLGKNATKKQLDILKLTWERRRGKGFLFEGNKNPMYGKHHTEETKQKMREKLKGRKSWNKGTKGIMKPNSGCFKKGEKLRLGKHHTDATKKLLREERLKKVIPFKDTLPERIIQQNIATIGIEFEKHKLILGQPDIFIEPNICIFVDGCYWHGCPQCYPNRNNLDSIQRYHITRDTIVTQGLINQGYIVLRLWEHEIHGDIDSCIGQIKKSIEGEKIVIP